MQLHHRFTIAAPIEQAWEAFNDLERVAPCFPGAQLGSVDGDDFTGSCKVKLGPISLLYTGKGTFRERDPSLYRAVIEAKGKDKRGNGTAGATVTAQLSEDGDSTLVEVETDLAITGKPAQFGRGVMQDVSDRLLDEFVRCLQSKLAPAVTSDAAPVTSTAAAPVTSTAAAQEPAPDPDPDWDPDQLNLMSIVAPAVLSRLGPPAVGVLLLVLLVRRLRRSH
jgi:carbon monoxide dehydrogenase subunit G